MVAVPSPSLAPPEVYEEPTTHITLNLGAPVSLVCASAAARSTAPTTRDPPFVRTV